MNTFDFLLFFNIASFLFFGTTCLFSPHMKLEFARYGLSNLQRMMTGILQLAGAFGLISGYFYTLIGVAASCGLSALMLAGLITRIKIKDGIYKSSPAFIYMVLSAIIGYQFFKML